MVRLILLAALALSSCEATTQAEPLAYTEKLKWY